MKAYEVPAGARSLDDLKLVERPDPKAGPGQILVRVRATALNYRDLLVVQGMYFSGAAGENTIALSDGAGEVIAIGSGVNRFKVGDRAAGTFFRNWIDGPPAPDARPSLGAIGIDGMLAEFAVLDQNDAVIIPSHLSFEEAATLPCAGVTAWNALHTIGNIRSGQTVLAIGTGGVSMFAVQFGRAAGARVIITSSSDDKLARAQALGAHILINYQRTPDWDAEVLKATGGRGADCVVEVGGAGTLARSMKSVAYAGRIALIGFVAGPQGDTAPQPLMRKGASIHGIFVGSRANFEAMNAAIEVNGIKPVIDRVFPFAEAPAAYRHLKSGAHFGKVVIRL
ncbi:MAG TPA: NAD(P)-dependent alcohol dehydrogenase [Steroidobacteraceae bacterium]|nr:NAD(P)-dependent alcohol dehydrogenase [Steroidobacteraceae bacterium]